MWKYRCKTHLMSLIGAFLIGVVFGVISYIVYGQDLQLYMQEILQETGIPASALPTIQAYLTNPVLQSISTGIFFAGLVNVVMLAQYITSKSSLSPFIFIIVLMFAAMVLLIIGVILLLPAVIVCIYGMVTLRSSLASQKKQSNISSDDEFVRVYQIHHHLDPSVKKLAEECKKNIRKVSFVWVLGLIAALCVMFFVQNFILLVALLLFFMISFNYLMRYYASSMMPIRLLLYQKCDPEACASACIYFSMNRKGKVKLKNHILLAQSLIYMDDPQLAMDVLIDYPRRDQSSTLQYWSLMATIYYMLKDGEALDRCKEEASKIRMNIGVQGVMVQSQELASIQNKVDLMNGQLNTCKKYYLQALQRAAFPFQQVDASYYIGMISFVEEDYSLANMYFDKVINLGNKISYVTKAKHFQSKINEMDLSSEDDFS